MFFWMPRGGRRRQPDSNRQSTTAKHYEIAIVSLLALSALAPNNLPAQNLSLTAPARQIWLATPKNDGPGKLVITSHRWTTEGFQQLDFRMAFSLTPKGQKEVVGVVNLQAQTAVDVDQHDVVLLT